ncbi:hypothetical protein BGX30_004719 [Mortierella sp. GBA39]|nr:hypothetical protein BGX30_004719 [Mortierella sp. GBA39]
MASGAAMNASAFSVDRYEDIQDVYDLVMSKDNLSISEVEALVSELGRLLTGLQMECPVVAADFQVARNQEQKRPAVLFLREYQFLPGLQDRKTDGHVGMNLKRIRGLRQSFCRSADKRNQLVDPILPRKMVSFPCGPVARCGRQEPHLQKADRFLFRRIGLGVHHTGPCAHGLNGPRRQLNLISHVVIMFKRAGDDVADDFQIMMRMFLKALFRT